MSHNKRDNKGGPRPLDFNRSNRIMCDCGCDSMVLESITLGNTEYGIPDRRTYRCSRCDAVKSFYN